jgi:subtilisin family serine protease
MLMRKQISLRWLPWLAVAVLLLSATVPVVGASVAGAEPASLDARLLEQFASAPGTTDFLVFLRDQADLSGASALPERAQRGQYVYDTLRAVADQSQARLRAELDALGAEYHPFYIVNALRVTGDEALARKLAARPEVARIVADPAFNGLDDPPPDPVTPLAVDAVEWNIQRVNADDVWGLGYTGQNIVVGGCDTGVDWTHPALVNQYRGGAGNHDYNWYDTFHEYAEPTDPNGHGTHTVGTMVGDDGAGNQIGMAPGAEWIACKVSSAGGTWKASKYLECWEWFLAPTRVDGTDPDPSKAPHIINNSWSCPGSEGCDPDTLRDAAKALYAAGIAIAKSGGNTGSACGSITNPGQYPELLATASFANGDVIAGSSSRGPVVVDGKTLIKPDIAAPGVSVRSSIPGGGYASLSGTSMAAPHTAGLIALLWSAQPALIGDLEATYQIVRASAQPKVDLQCSPNGPGGVPNNVWGWGIIDALAAVQAATNTGLGVLNGAATDSASSDPLPGVVLEITQAGGGPSREVTTDAAGFYSETLLAATYDLTATLYGYLPLTITGAAVVSNNVTTLDLLLDPAPIWTLSGTVTEQGSGLPLRATLTLLDTPISAETDPATGAYAAAAAQGDYVLRAESPGYVTQERIAHVVGDLTEDFVLEPELTYYVRDNTASCGPSFDWIDIAASGTAHPLADDASTNVSLGGPSFTFYGTAYTTLYVGSNGFVTFGSGSSYPGGNAIPSTFLPNNGIYAFWDDLNPANGSQGTIYTDLVDGYLFVVEFYQVQHWPSGNPETFEIVLDTDSGAITLQYLAVSDSSWTSVGLENSSGTAGVSYAFHDPAVPSDGLAVAFYPVSGAHPAAQGLGIVQGMVTDADTGDPIESATVDAMAQTSSAVAVFPVDASGIYSGVLCADLYTMFASAPGYHQSPYVPVAVYSDTLLTQDFDLARTEADTWITKTVPATAIPGDYLTYTLSFGSLGPDEVPWGEVYDPLPEGVVYITSTGESVYDPGEHAVMWELFNLPADFASTESLVVQVSSTVTVGLELCNHAGFNAINEGAPLDPKPGNNDASACTTVEAPPSPYHYVYLPLVVKDYAP